MQIRELLELLDRVGVRRGGRLLVGGLRVLLLLVPAASCAPQRDAWRRLTRFETAVAVPATTAVRAIPRSSPGMT